MEKRNIKKKKDNCFSPTPKWIFYSGERDYVFLYVNRVWQFRPVPGGPIAAHCAGRGATDVVEVFLGIALFLGAIAFSKKLFIPSI